MSLSLYELNEQIAKFRFEFDEETGEILNEDALDELNIARDEKIESLLIYAKVLRAEAKAIKDEEKNLADRRKAKENKADRIEDYVARNLNGEKFETPRVKVIWRKSERVIIPDDYAVPDRFCNHEIVRKPDKTVIKTYLKGRKLGDEDVKWASLEERQNMSVK